MDAPQLSMVLPQQTGQNYLELLVNTNFGDTQDLWFAHAVRTKYQRQSLLLFKYEQKDQDAKKRKKQKNTLVHQYMVEVNHDNPNHLGSSYRPSNQAGSNTDIDINKPKELFESMVMSLEPQGRASRRSSTSRRSSLANEQAPTKFPRFVVEIGEIVVYTWRKNEDGTSGGLDECRPIGCHMVMDIEPPFDQRTLWLVHRYRGVERGVHLTADCKWDRDIDLFGWLGHDTWENVMRGITTSFDIAQLATNTADWYLRGGECRHLEEMEKLMQDTAMRGNCRLLTPEGLYEEFMAKTRGIQ
ncbi:hypothetical protein PG995_012280 [Apiospora arundinis]